MIGLYEELNAENILFRYGEFVFTNGELIYPRGKDAKFSSICDFLDKISNFQISHAR